MALAELGSKKCVTCKDTDRMGVEEAKRLLAELPGLTLKLDPIEKDYRFKTYMTGLDFAYAIGKIPESENHHPDMLIGWCRVKLTVSRDQRSKPE